MEELTTQHLVVASISKSVADMEGRLIMYFFNVRHHLTVPFHINLSCYIHKSTN